MNIAIIGGGPGGAFTAALIQKANPDWEVTVYERSPPAVTYGWGIVLPEKLYPTLRAADERICEQIETKNTHWDPIDTFHQGEQVRCGGHPYTSILRSELLEILQGRCQELGVDMQFETEIEDIHALAGDADLVVGADGIHSTTRNQYADAFGTDLQEGENLFSWFGTEQQFDALTHIYEETEHGLWHAGAYPGPMSTFVITCDPETWQAASIGEKSEAEYIAYLEDVFADHLGDHGLVSNNDRWRPFTTVTNESWYHDNIVLLGDSAHTAHFTIGSGTRMALEDAIGLVDAIEAYEGNIQAALEQYENDRKPHVELLQEAAERSQQHFEHLERYAKLDPYPFAALYLTRTGHNSYESLREDDHSFVTELNRWFASTAGEGTTFDSDPGPPLHQPFSLGELTLPNRLVAVREPDSESTLEDQIDVFQNVDPAGLVAIPITVFAGADRPTGLHSEAQVEGWNSVLDQVARGRERYAAARLEFDTIETDSITDVNTQREFQETAERAARAGFDALEIDFSDRIGAARGPEGVPISVIDAVHDAWPEDRPLLATVPAVDGDTKECEASYTIARMLMDYGCDAISVVPTADDPDPVWTGAEHSKRLRNELDVPTIAGGPHPSADAVNTALVSGRADLCTIDPDAYNEAD